MGRFANLSRWTMTYEGVPAPELGWVDRQEYRDPYGRVIEVTKHYGSDDYRVALLSPAGGLLVLKEGTDRALLLREVKDRAKRLNLKEPGESLVLKGGELHLVRPTDATHRDLTEWDLCLVEQVEVEKLRESKVGAPISPRLVLAMTREIRRWRAKARKSRARAPKAKRKPS